MSDLFADSVFYWTFSSTSGDAYFGYTVADTVGLSGVPEGAVFSSPYGPSLGFYTITNIVDYVVDLSAHYGIPYYTEGATVVSAYYDSFDEQFLPTLYGSQGVPTTYTGLGQEFDYVAASAFGYEQVGFGGYFLIA